jgi:hypothetical protein
VVEQKTGVKKRQQENIWKKAGNRRFKPSKDPRILEAYVIDGERSGRPKEILKEQEGDIKGVRRSFTFSSSK